MGLGCAIASDARHKGFLLLYGVFCPVEVPRNIGFRLLLALGNPMISLHILLEALHMHSATRMCEDAGVVRLGGEGGDILMPPSMGSYMVP